MVRSGPAAPPLLAAPGGDTLARLSTDVPLEILSRDGDWALVRLEGWVSLPGLASDVPSSPAEEQQQSRGLSVEELSSNPDEYEGQVVELVLEFISLERAERIRGIY